MLKACYSYFYRCTLIDYVYYFFCTMHYFFFYLLIYFLLSVCDVKKLFNPLSPNGDQHQFSPNNIYMLPRGMVMRVNKMITKEKKFWSVIKFSQLIL